MRYTVLEKSQISISALGFGTWGIGGLTEGNSSYGQTSDKESLDALNFAIDSGVNFFDTANIYGNGHSEILLSKVLKGRRDSLIVATKCGKVGHFLDADFSTSSLEKSLDQSLKRLDTDYVDILQLHDPGPDLASNDELLNLLRKLKQSGKVRAVGVSVKSPAHGLLFMNKIWDTIQCNFNMLDIRAIECGLLDRAIKNKIGIIARTPLCFGFLSGNSRFNINSLRLGDHRLNFSKRQLEVWSNSHRYFADLLQLKKVKLNLLALKFATSFEAICSTIPGMLKVDEVIENLKFLEIEDFLVDEINQILKINQRNEFYLKDEKYGS